MHRLRIFSPFRLSKIVLIATLFLHTSQYLHTKALIFDLGYTLVKPQKTSIMGHLGLWDCFAFYTKHGNNTTELLSDTLFKVLSSHGLPEETTSPRDPKGRVMPSLMCNWLKGLKTSKETQELALQALKKHNFISEREQRLVENTITWMFDPTLFANSLKIIKPALKLVKECARVPNKEGKQAHTLYILSNWDTESFTQLYLDKHNYPLFRYFKPEHIFISGLIHDVKPNHSIFKYLMNKNKLQPSDCILIDDQEENIIAARACGMTGVHVKDGEYGPVRKELKKLGILKK